MGTRRRATLVTGVLAAGVLPVLGALLAAPAPGRDAWGTCRDREHGFALRHPPDWQARGPAGRCVQLQKGASPLPEGVPEVDVSIRVTPARGGFPDEYLRDQQFPAPGTLGTGGGVTYSERRELPVGGLPAIRARFRSAGPTPNWGVEYAVRRGGDVLQIYISQPAPEVEALFDEMVQTLRWPG